MAEENTNTLPDGLAQEQAELAHARAETAEAELANHYEYDDEGEVDAYFEQYGHDWDNINAMCDHYGVPQEFADSIFTPDYIRYEKEMGFDEAQANRARVVALGQAIESYKYNQNEMIQNQQSMEYYHAEQLATHFGDMSMDQLADKIYTHNLGAEGNLRVDPDVDSYETIKLKMMTGAAPSPNSAYASKGVEFNSQIDSLLTKHGLDLNASDEKWHEGIMRVMRDNPKEFDVLEKVRGKYYGSLAKRG